MLLIGLMRSKGETFKQVKAIVIVTLGEKRWLGNIWMVKDDDCLCWIVYFVIVA